MLTRTQIQRLAQRQRIGMQMQERDYLQHLLLLALTGHSQGLVFKGGTALRLVYRGNRFSEDLDFNVATGADSLEGVALYAPSGSRPWMIWLTSAYRQRCGTNGKAS